MQVSAVVVLAPGTRRKKNYVVYKFGQRWFYAPAGIIEPLHDTALHSDSQNRSAGYATSLQLKSEQSRPHSGSNHQLRHNAEVRGLLIVVRKCQQQRLAVLRPNENEAERRRRPCRARRRYSHQRAASSHSGAQSHVAGSHAVPTSMFECKQTCVSEMRTSVNHTVMYVAASARQQSSCIHLPRLRVDRSTVGMHQQPPSSYRDAAHQLHTRPSRIWSHSEILRYRLWQWWSGKAHMPAMLISDTCTKEIRF